MGVRSPHVEEWCSKEVPLCSALCRIGRRMVADYDPGVMFSIGYRPARLDPHESGTIG